MLSHVMVFLLLLCRTDHIHNLFVLRILVIYRGHCILELFYINLNDLTSGFFTLVPGFLLEILHGLTLPLGCFLRSLDNAFLLRI